MFWNTSKVNKKQACSNWGHS